MADVPRRGRDVPNSCRLFLGMNTSTHTTPAVSPRTSLTRDQVMTAREVAELLQLPVSTVYYLARQGQLPVSRFGRTYRFLRPRLEELLNA